MQNVMLYHNWKLEICRSIYPFTWTAWLQNKLNSRILQVTPWAVNFCGQSTALMKIYKFMTVYSTKYNVWHVTSFRKESGACDWFDKWHWTWYCSRFGGAWQPHSAQWLCWWEADKVYSNRIHRVSVHYSVYLTIVLCISSLLLLLYYCYTVSTSSNDFVT